MKGKSSYRFLRKDIKVKVQQITLNKKDSREMSSLTKSKKMLNGKENQPKITITWIKQAHKT